MASISFKCVYCKEEIIYEKRYDGLIMLTCPHCNKDNDLRDALSFSKQLKELFETFGLEILNNPLYFYAVASDAIIGHDEFIRLIYMLSRIRFFEDVYSIINIENKEEKAKELARSVHIHYFIDEGMTLKIILVILDACNDSIDSDKIVLSFGKIFGTDSKEMIEVETKKLSYNQALYFYLRRDYINAKKWFSIALDEEDYDSYYYLGLMLFKGFGEKEKDRQNAFKYFLSGANKGNSACMYYVGIYYYYGFQGVTDYKLAFKYFLKAALKGYVEAMFSTALCYQNAQGVEADEAKALEWYISAADKGNMRAAYYAGELLIVSKNIAHDYQKGIYYIKLSADHDNPDAQYLLALLYLNGVGVEKDKEKAIHWLRKAASNGNKTAIEKVKKIDNR